MNKYINN